MEIVRDLQRNWFFASMKMVILGLALVLIYHVAAFAGISKSEISRSFSSDAEVDMYGITDTLSDPDEFSAFRESPEALDSLALFYNSLDRSPTTKFLSVFDQPMPVIDFRGGREFDAKFDGDPDSGGAYVDDDTGQQLTDVKSFQVNRSAFEFYSLQVSDGPGIDWSEVDYQSRTIPVVLGANYSGIYRVGDVLRSQYYFEDFSFVVNGILSPDSSIYYQGELNTFIDDAMIVPYPPVLELTPAESQYFFGILAFAMISGDLAVDPGTESDAVLRRLGEISNRTEFDDFTVLNAPTYLVQFQLTRQLIEDNTRLLIGMAVLLMICVGLANGIITAHLAKRRWAVQRIENLLGVSARITRLRTVSATGIEYACVLVVLAMLVSVLPQANYIALIPVACVATVVLMADIALQAVLRRRNIRTHLLAKDES